jgi:MFS family permease
MTSAVADSHASPRTGLAALIVTMAALASQSMLFGLPPPLLPAMASSFGAHGPFIAQMIMASGSLGLMLTSVASGAAVRAVGLRRMLILAALIYGLCGMVPAATANVSLILASRVATGAGSALLTTACTMLLAHLLHGDARSKAMGFQTATGSLAGLATLGIAGATVAALGWHVPFLLYGAFAAPVALLALFGVPEIRLAPSERGQGFAAALRCVWPLCLAGCALMMIPMIAGSQTPFLLNAIGVTRPVEQSVVIGMVTLFSMVSGAGFGAVQARLGPNRTLALGLACAAAGMACLGLAGTAPIAALGCALIGIGVGLYVPYLWTMATGLVPEALRGHAIGLLNTSMFLGGFVYPFVVGALQRWVGLPGAMDVMAAMVAIWTAAAGAKRARTPRQDPSFTPASRPEPRADHGL